MSEPDLVRCEICGNWRVEAYIRTVTGDLASFYNLPEGAILRIVQHCVYAGDHDNDCEKQARERCHQQPLPRFVTRPQGIGKCRVCGCTDHKACEKHSRNISITWIDRRRDLCLECAKENTDDDA